MKKLILISLVIFLINNCGRDIAGQKVPEGIDWSVSNGNGGRAILLKAWYKTMEEEDLKEIIKNTCINYGKVLSEFKLERSAIDSSFYSYKCDYSEAMKLKIKKYAEEKKLEERKRYEREQELIKQNQEKNKPEFIRKKKLEEKKTVEQNKQRLFENAKAECEEIGYKKGTEKFGECVLDLTE